MPPPSPDSPVDDVLRRLQEMAVGDVAWKDGRVFSLAYFANEEILDLADRAYAMYSSANGLNFDAFPSLRRIQSDVVSTVSNWLHGGPEAAGFMTSGGTESLLLSVESARKRARTERSVSKPNVVLPASAHAAFEKACSYFDVESRRIPVGSDWRADVDAMADAVDDQTILLVGSAPQYPQGVIDPVEDIASLGAERDLNVHVDACMGGVTLPFLERSGEEVPLWDFRVDGVTSISVDLHKYGYTSKGASVLLHRTKHLRSFQTFVTDNWLGGTYGSSGILGTKSGGPMAAAWAVMNFLGDDGYRELTMRARRTCLRLADAVDEHPDLILWARPDATLVSFGARPELDVLAVADLLLRKGWYLDKQGSNSLHCTVHAGHADTIDRFVDELYASVEAVKRSDAEGSSGSYATVD